MSWNGVVEAQTSVWLHGLMYPSVSPHMRQNKNTWQANYSRSLWYNRGAETADSKQTGGTERVGLLWNTFGTGPSFSFHWEEQNELDSCTLKKTTSLKNCSLN